MKGKIFMVLLVFLSRSEEHTSELQSHSDLVCRLLLEKKKNKQNKQHDANPWLESHRLRVRNNNVVAHAGSNYE